MGKKIYPILLVILASVFATLDLANYGLPPTHDGEYHIMRFQQFYTALSEGTLYPRWAPDFNNGFGIPLFNYVYPLPNYFASIFHFLGFGFIESLKLNMVIASITGAVLMYLWSKKYWGEWGGVVSSIFYTYSPYHLLDIYVRGSVGEVWALAIFPGLLWSYSSFVENGRYRFFVLSSLFLALLIYSHNILALLFFIFFLFYSAFLILNKKEILKSTKELLIVILIGFGLAAPFWLPAILETKFVQGLQVASPQNHFPKVYQLIYSSWGYGFSGTDAAGQMSFQIGLANIIIIAGVLFLLKSHHKKIIIFSLTALMISVFLITHYSSYFWELPLIKFVQYPWRLLSVVILITSFLAGSIVSDALFKRSGKQIFLSFMLVIISVGFSLRYAKAPFYHQREDEHYLSRSNFTDGTNSPGDGFNTIWLGSIPESQKGKIVTDGSVQIYDTKTNSYTFNVRVPDESVITVNAAYFPGWTASVNGSKTYVNNNKGIISLSVPKGASVVRVWLENTLLQKVSIVYFLISVLLIIFLRRSFHNENRNRHISGK